MRRHGVSRCDVAVLIAVLATALGLGIVVTQGIRTASRRTQTNDHLKQCALAVQEFHDLYRRLPDAFEVGGSYPKEPKSLWFHLLPFVGHTKDYKHGETDTTVEAFTAPRDPSTSDPAGLVSFAGNLRVFAYNTFTPARCNDNKSALTMPAIGTPMSSNLTLPRIVDGTSNVFMLATRYAVCSGKPTAYAAHPSNHGGFFGAGVYDLPANRVGDRDDLMFQIAPETDPSLPNACNPSPGIYGHAFDSNGLSTAMADGTVRNIATTMTTTNFMHAVCPGDGNVRGWVEN